MAKAWKGDNGHSKSILKVSFVTLPNCKKILSSWKYEKISNEKFLLPFLSSISWKFLTDGFSTLPLKFKTNA